MQQQDLKISIRVDATAQQVFDSINKVDRWWTENLQGNSCAPGDEFTVWFDDVHISTQRLVELIPGKKITWLVTDSKLNFTKDIDEWTNTRISFEIGQDDKHTTLLFTHYGLVPSKECFGACSGAWKTYLENSLVKLITTGVGNPAPKKL